MRALELVRRTQPILVLREVEDTVESEVDERLSNEQENCSHASLEVWYPRERGPTAGLGFDRDFSPHDGRVGHLWQADFENPVRV